MADIVQVNIRKITVQQQLIKYLVLYPSYE
jgi:hypothetical protein